MLAAREAARIYMEVILKTYFTRPSCTAPRSKLSGCDIGGPAGSLGHGQEALSSILGAHGVHMCKSGLVRTTIRESSPAELAKFNDWLQSPINRQRALLFRPLARNESIRQNAACPRATAVCSWS